MTPARLTARMAILEGTLARLRPPAPGDGAHGWLRWASLDELMDLERLTEAEHRGHELSPAEQLRAVESEVAATRRM